MNKKLNKEEKSIKIKDLPEIVLENEGKAIDFNFRPIYELGRLLTKGNTDFDMLNLEKINCPPSLKENIYRFFHILAGNILNENLNFHPLLINFVVFDPEDKKGERFYMAICSTSTELIKRYLNEIKICGGGKSDADDENGQERRTILTDSYIYKSPFFYSQSEYWKKENSFFHLLKAPGDSGTDRPVRVCFGSLKATKKSLRTHEVSLKKIIEIFFDRIDKKLLQDGKGLIKIDQKEIAEEKYAFNTCALIPLLRPACSFVDDRDFRLRGGGVFIYGHTSPNDNPVEMFARLRHFFNRIVLDETSTPIAFDYLRHDCANHHIHDFKTFLSSEFTEKIKRVVKRNQLTDQDRNELNEVIYGADMFRRYLTNILEAYRDFVNDEGEMNDYCASDLKKLISALNIEFANQLQVNFIDQVGDDHQTIKANDLIMEKIFRNLYTNTIVEYQKQNIPFGEREASATWYSSMNQTGEYQIITIAYFNKYLKFNKALIKSFGIKPIGDGDVQSTGLGGYFINNTLGWMFAEENSLPDEVKTTPIRYIRVENTDEGEIFTFKFKLIHK